MQAWKVPYLNMEGFLEKSLKIKSALKNTGKLSFDVLELCHNSVNGNLNQYKIFVPLFGAAYKT